MTGESSSSSSTDVPAFVLVASSRNTNVTGSGRYPWMSSRSMASMKQVPLRAMGTCALAGLSKKVRVSTAMRLSTNHSGRTQALGSNSERWLSAKTTGRQPALRHHELPWWKSRRVWSASQTHWQTTRSLVPVCGRRISQSVSNLRWRCSILENDPNIERFEWYRHDARWSRLLASPAECLKFPPIPAHLVRVRFAPSPTGNLHVGGARTALFNWLYARNQGGHFIVRIEDTDQARSTRASEVAVLRDLRWLGLDWDEGPTYPDQPTTQAYLGERGPYRQSERAHIYEAVAARLIKAGAVYPCFCSEEALERKRRAAEAAGQPPQYDGTCRDASPEHIVERLKRGDPYALRFRVPAESRVTIRDVVRGDVSWDAGATIGDFIIVRSSGVPVYNFCVAVDDALMGITTVIRAEEHLTNTLRQALILDALGYDRPQYAHVSLILGTDRQKLSKRHGATSIDQFAREGFLPEAMMNYLALLGWNDGTEREIYTPQELIQVFSLSRITKSAAVFDMNKLRWMNGLHLRSMQTEKLCGILTRFWLDAKIIRKPEETEDLYDAASAEQRDEHGSDSSKLYWEFTRHATELLRGSIELAKDCVPLLGELLLYPLEETIEHGDADELLTLQGGFLEIARAVLASYESGDMPTGEDERAAIVSTSLRELHPSNEDPFIDEWKAWVKGIGTRLGRKSKRLFHPVRLALTGRMSGPDVGEIVRVLALAHGVVQVPFVPLSERMRILKQVVQKMEHQLHAASSGTSTSNTTN